ncbi:MAG: hypothetical protein PHV46_03645 [Bacteroidales bacterium]|jgi:hypothetical protein|nr:hypothetical protein [Bacteroidales bacterium]MDD4058450.1 hypothetical protein [Bacteroidales bacterium]
MKESDFDKRVREQMESYGEIPDSLLWGSIERTLAVNTRKIYFYRSVRAVSAVAAAVALFLIVGRDSVFNITQRVHEGIVTIVEDPAVIEFSESLPNRGDIVPIILKKRGVTAKLFEEKPLQEEQTPQKSYDQITQQLPTENEEQKHQEKTEKQITTSRESQNIFSDFTIEDQIKIRKRKPALSLSTMLTPSAGRSDRVMNTFMHTNFKELSSSLDRDVNQFETVYDTRYLPTISVGLQVMVPLNRTLSLVTGVNYSILYSITDEQRISESVRREQTLHYIGIPLYLYSNIYSSEKFILYGGVGATLEKGVVERIKKNGAVPLDISNNIPGLQWSAGATIGGEYVLGKNIGLYADPMLMYYFKGNQPKSIRSAQPLQFRLEIGLRYRF